MAIGVVVDTGPLIHLAQADAVGLLEVFDSIVVPKTVIDEVRNGTVLEALNDLNYTIETEVDTEEEFPALDPGETAAVALADDHESILLTDDLDARKLANELGIEVHGSIGVVLRGYALGKLSKVEARKLIQALKVDTSLYLADPLVEYALQVLESDHPSWR